MTTTSTKLERRLQVAGILVVIGLLVELVSLYWSHPTAFLFFLLFGGSLMFFGIVLYLYALVASGDSRAG